MNREYVELECREDSRGEGWGYENKTRSGTHSWNSIFEIM
jgi:hypothetical protein